MILLRLKVQISRARINVGTILFKNSLGFLHDVAGNSSHPVYGNSGKVIAHEWAKLRWGVSEEHGYPGDKHYPISNHVRHIQNKIALYFILLVILTMLNIIAIANNVIFCLLKYQTELIRKFTLTMAGLGAKFLQ